MSAKFNLYFKKYLHCYKCNDSHVNFIYKWCSHWHIGTRTATTGWAKKNGPVWAL